MTPSLPPGAGATAADLDGSRRPPGAVSHPRRGSDPAPVARPRPGDADEALTFAYCSRRAQQEQVAAINARTPAAAAAHAALSRLHATRALLALSNPETSTDAREDENMQASEPDEARSFTTH